MGENQTPPPGFVSFEMQEVGEFITPDGDRHCLPLGSSVEITGGLSPRKYYDLCRETDKELCRFFTIYGRTEEGFSTALIDCRTEAYAREVLGTLSVGDDGATILVASYGELLETADALGWDSESPEHDYGYKRDEEGGWSDAAADALEEAAEEYIQSRGLKVVYKED